MSHIPSENADILNSKTRRGLPAPVDYGHASTTEYIQALDNFHRVFGSGPAITW